MYARMGGSVYVSVYALTYVFRMYCMNVDMHVHTNIRLHTHASTMQHKCTQIKCACVRVRVHTRVVVIVGVGIGFCLFFLFVPDLLHHLDLPQLGAYEEMYAYKCTQRRKTVSERASTQRER